jgi:hypothetical protein
MTTTQEILRAAAAIVYTSWSAKDDALDADGKAVPLYIAGIGDTSRAGLNPAAVSFSAYGAITKATKEAPKAVMTGQRHPGPPNPPVSPCQVFVLTRRMAR